jgi:CxxC-x17-CxxC domain-containing protein
MRSFGLKENFKPAPKDSTSRDSFSRGTGPREMHEATCADCKKQCTVPFKPNGARPVYCSDCYQKHKPATTSRRY